MTTPIYREPITSPQSLTQPPKLPPKTIYEHLGNALDILDSRDELQAKGVTFEQRAVRISERKLEALCRNLTKDEVIGVINFLKDQVAAKKNELEKDDKELREFWGDDYELIKEGSTLAAGTLGKLTPEQEIAKLEKRIQFIKNKFNIQQ